MALLAAVTLELGDFGIIGMMLAGMGTGLATLMQAYLKGLGRRIDSVELWIGKVEESKADWRAVKGIETEIGDLKKDKADKTEVFREDILAREQRQGMGKQLQRIETKLETDFGIVGMISGLVEELKKSNGTQS